MLQVFLPTKRCNITYVDIFADEVKYEYLQMNYGQAPCKILLKCRLTCNGMWGAACLQEIQSNFCILGGGHGWYTIFFEKGMCFHFKLK